MKEIYLYGLISITNVEINNKDDIIISLSNGSICIYNHNYNNPEYIISYHYKKLTNFIWYEKQKSIISVSLDKTIKVYQLPIRWPAEFIRANKEINDVYIIKDLIQETKNLFYRYNIDNYNEGIINDNNRNIKENNKIRNYGNFWDVGNLDPRNNKLNKIIKKEDNNEKMFINNNNNILNSYNINNNKNDNLGNNKYSFFKAKNIYKIDNYEEYFNIFSDDLDGWSI